MKKFFKKTEGFTLVELIIVIAILGILAGVGTVGYSGYIKKAQVAGDQQLLAAVNQAYAAACIENGINATQTQAAAITLDSDGKIPADAIQVSDPADKADKIEAAFAKYFAGNEGSAFKVIESLQYDPQRGFWNSQLLGSGAVGLSFGGGTVFVNAGDIANLSKSTFADESVGLGTDGLLDKVADVTTFAAGMSAGGALSEVYSSPEFMQYAADAMGMTLTGDLTTDLSAFEAKLGELSGGDATKAAQIQANAAVLFAANKTTQMNQADIADLLSTEGTKGKIMTELTTGDSGKALSQAAAAYGMYTAFAYASGDETLINKTNNPSAILNDLDNEDFQEYMKSEQGKKDLAGYVSALSMVNSSTKDTAAVTTVLTGGYNSTELKALLASALAK